MKKIIVVLSGGMDSTVLLHRHIHQGDIVRAVAVNYGQRHEKELTFAKRTVRKLGVDLDVINLACLGDMLPGSSQTDRSVVVPEGHYSSEQMKLTVVPNRNMILLSLALGVAIAHKFDGVSYGAHAGDHAIYPDCRNEFVDALDGAAKLADWHVARIIRPFITMTKAEIVRAGFDLGVDFNDTWSCYKGEEWHCGRCGTCLERREAFHIAGVSDPTRYQISAPSVQQMVASGWTL